MAEDDAETEKYFRRGAWGIPMFKDHWVLTLAILLLFGTAVSILAGEYLYATVSAAGTAAALLYYRKWKRKIDEYMLERNKHKSD